MKQRILTNPKNTKPTDGARLGLGEEYSNTGKPEDGLGIRYTTAFDVGYSVLNRFEDTCVFIGNLQGLVAGGELLLESHNQLYQVQRISIEVLNKRGVFGHVRLVNP